MRAPGAIPAPGPATDPGTGAGPADGAGTGAAGGAATRRAAPASVTAPRPLGRPDADPAGGTGPGDDATPAWVGVDWGTSRLRAWGFDESGGVLFHVAGEAGMGGLDRDGFEPALLRAIGARLGPGRATPVVACGMVGSRQGWVEAPYRDLPCPPLGAGLVRAPAADPRLAVHVIPGLRQRRPHADVMRGEETQIAGFLAAHPHFDGVICLPGTHAKWAEVSAGEVVSFATFMTGELYAALSRHTVLRHSLGPEAKGPVKGPAAGGAGAAEGDDAPWDEAAFDAALAETLSRPERLARALFSIRAEDLVEGLSPAAARARLSGLLIGAELAAARPWWLGRDVAVVGAPGIAARYGRALSAQGIAPRLADADEMTRRGLAAAHAMLTEGTKA